MSENLIRLEFVSKKFCRSLKKSMWYGLRDLGNEIIGKRHSVNHELRPQEFWAVKDVSFDLERGQCLGLLGRNGAGKTTLLRMLNGLIKPDTGRIEMRGRVGSLIALGVGFNPVLTGRENIKVNASLLGLSKREIDDTVEQIIDFAEIEEFIDSPVQNYSSGMHMRLGFAVATSFNPDIVLLDEVLAVGDIAFRSKCYNRLSQIQKNAAVIFVSHAVDQIARICTETLVLSKGVIIQQGDVAKGISAYEGINASGMACDASFQNLAFPIERFQALMRTPEIRCGNDLKVTLVILSKEEIRSFRIRLFVYNILGLMVADGVIWGMDIAKIIAEGANYLDILLVGLGLRNGTYSISFMILDSSGEQIVWSHQECKFQMSDAYMGAITDNQLKLVCV